MTLTQTINGPAAGESLTGTNPGDVSNPGGIDLVNGLGGDDTMPGLSGTPFFCDTTTGRLFFHDGDTGSCTRSLIAVIANDPASLSLSNIVLA